MKKTKTQRGNTVIGLIVGLVLGLGIALGVAVYVTKVPIPFISKTQRGGAEQDEAEARKNRDWNPNAPLTSNRAPVQPPPTPPAANNAPASVGPLHPPTAAVPPAPAERTVAVPVPVMPGAARPAAATPSADPLGDLARARAGTGVPADGSAPDPFMYFVQAGAFRSTEDAESQRAKLSLMGVEARVTEREQAGRTVYRVRAGPFNKKEDADRLKERLDSSGMDANLVRVQR